MIETPALVDENADLHLHGRQGAVLPIEFQDEAGIARDMSAANVVFEVGPDVNVTLTPVAGTPGQMLLTLPRDTVELIFNSADKNFALVEESAAVPAIHWQGVVYVTGWVE